MCYYVPNYNIYSDLLTHSTNTVQAAVVGASPCSTGNAIILQLKTLLSLKGETGLHLNLLC